MFALSFDTVSIDLWCSLIFIRNVLLQKGDLLNCSIVSSKQIVHLFQMLELIVQRWKFQFGKLLNLYKLRLRVRVLLMEVNVNQRSKEMRQSHDTI